MITNPDIITAFSLLIFFFSSVGALRITDQGFLRLVFSYSVICMPYSILTMLPRSSKLSKSTFESALDLGFSRIRSWFFIYLRHMLPAILTVVLICFVFTFDDFIIARIVSNTTTLGTLLYEQKQAKTWILALGVLLLFMILIINLIFVIVKLKEKNDNKNNVNKLLLILIISSLVILFISFIFLFIYGYSNNEEVFLNV